MNDNVTGNALSTTTTSTTSSSSERKGSPNRRKVVNLINSRVAKALNALRVLGNVTKLSVLDQNLADADVNRIMTAIEAEVAHLKRRLTSAATGVQLDVEFDLDAKPERVD